MKKKRATESVKFVVHHACDLSPLSAFMVAVTLWHSARGAKGTVSEAVINIEQKSSSTLSVNPYAFHHLLVQAQYRPPKL